MKFDYLAASCAGAMGANIAHILYPPSPPFSFYVAAGTFGVLCLIFLALSAFQRTKL